MFTSWRRCLTTTARRERSVARPTGDQSQTSASSSSRPLTSTLSGSAPTASMSICRSVRSITSRWRMVWREAGWRSSRLYRSRRICLWPTDARVRLPAAGRAPRLIGWVSRRPMALSAPIAGGLVRAMAWGGREEGWGAANCPRPSIACLPPVTGVHSSRPDSRRVREGCAGPPRVTNLSFIVENPPMLQLHHYPSTASMAPHLLLEELGVPYELKLVDRTQQAHKSADYLRLNPNGLIPVLIDGELVLYESAAICLHLVDTHPEHELAPAVGTSERAHFYKWLVWLTNTLQAALIVYFYPERWADTDEAIAQVK